MKLRNIACLTLAAVMSVLLCSCGKKDGSVPEEEKIMPESGAEQNESPAF